MFLGGVSQGILNYQQQQQQDQQQQADLAYRKMLMQQMQDQMAANREAQARAQQANQTQALMIGAQGPQPPAPGQASVPMQQPGAGAQMPPQPQGMGAGSPPPPSPQQQMSMMGAPGGTLQQRPPIPPYRTVASSGAPLSTPQQAPGMQAPPPLAGVQPPAQNGTPAPGQLPTPSLSQVPQLVNQMLNAPSVRDQAIKTLKAQGATNEQIANWLNSDSGMNWIAGSQKSQDDKIKVLTEAQKVAQDAFEDSLRTQQQTEAERHNKVGEKQRGQEIGLEGARFGLEKQKFAASQSPSGGGSKNQSDADAAMVLQGAPRTAVVGGMGKESTARWQAAKAAAVDTLMKEKGMTAAQAGAYIANQELEYKARGGALNAIEKRASGIEYTTEQIKNNIDTMNSVLDKVSAKGGAKILNQPLNKLREQFSDEDRGVLDLVTQQVATEYERQLQGGQLSVAQLHTGAAEDAKRLLNQDMTPSEIRAKLPIMMKEIEGGARAAGTVKGNLLGSSGPQSAPRVGDVQQGYRFKGGNPADPNSWEKQ